MAPVPDGEDPGWFTTRSMLWALVPGFGLTRAMADGQASALAMLRAVFTSFAMTLVAFGVILAFIAGGTDASRPSSSVVAAAVATLGVVSLVTPRLIERPLDCSSAAALLGGYRTRFFLRIAFADTAALSGFVGAFLAGEAWLYLLGGAFATVGFVRLAPTARNIERDQDALNQQGCGLSLLHQLATTQGAGTA